MKLRGLRELQVVVGMMCILLLWHMVINKRRQKSLDIKSVKTTIFAKRRSESPKKVFKTPLKITRTTTRPWSSLRLEGFTAGKNLETTPDVNVNKSTDFCSMHARTLCAHSRSYIDFCLLLFFIFCVIDQESSPVLVVHVVMSLKLTGNRYFSALFWQPCNLPF